MESLLEMLGMLSVFSSFGSLVSIAVYVLQALGLYTLAQRRGIQHAWLAWVPVGSMWILGSIADDYQLKAKGQVKNRRKLLMILTAVVVVLAFILCGSLFGMVIDAVLYGDSLSVEDIVGELLSMTFAALALSAVSVVTAVFQYICLYDLYASCDPDNKTLFLVLSIFLSGLTAVFVFLCRHKDQGMYPPAPYGGQYQQSYRNWQ